jgi:hypothetical protein
MLGKLGDIAGKKACESANEHAGKSHEDEGEDGHEGLRHFPFPFPPFH